MAKKVIFNFLHKNKIKSLTKESETTNKVKENMGKEKV